MIEGTIEGVHIEGNLVINNSYSLIHPQGWGRIRWAWHALRGRPFNSPNSLLVTQCSFEGKLIIKDGEQQ